jgi:hypothetical protein
MKGYSGSDPCATKPTLRFPFLTDLGRFGSLYCPPSEDPSVSEGRKESRTRGGVERAVEEEVFSGFWLTAASAHHSGSRSSLTWAVSARFTARPQRTHLFSFWILSCLAEQVGEGR